MLALVERRKAVACRDRTAALITIADAVLTRYQAAKDRRGELDYDDLIEKALALLGGEGSAWVHYKLDQGIDHVLIDEAQDTSPKQWEIVRRLTSEFFAGAGARSITRTIFAVGDEKQSIFSFQGAAPREFEVMHRSFHGLAAGRRTRVSPCALPPFVSLRPERARAPSTRSLLEPRHLPGSPPMRSRPCTSRCPTPHRGWWRSGTRSSPRANARSRPGMRRSTN